LLVRRFVFGGAAVVALLSAAACSGPAARSAGHSGPTVQASWSASPTLTAYTAPWLHFRYPASWTAHVGYNVINTIYGVDLLLSNQAVHNPCTAYGCGWPVGDLGPGGVFVEWADQAYPRGAYVSSSFGAPVTVGGRQSRQAISRPGDCGAIGGTETISVQIPDDKYNIYVVTACVRGPDLDRTVGQVQALIDSVSFPRS
jgi:hypothetical protein